MERRYTDEEIRQIFGAADRPKHARRSTSTEGATLSELQEIGKQVGVDPSRIEEVALALDRSNAAPTTLGMRYTVERELLLSRQPTDSEWAAIVTEVTKVFNSVGQDRSTRQNRHWSIGTTQVLVEPTFKGNLLRLASVKGDAKPMNRVGITGIILGAAAAVGMLVGGEPLGQIVTPLLIAAPSSALLAYNAHRLEKWRRTREAQMETVIEQTSRLLDRPKSD